MSNDRDAYIHSMEEQNDSFEHRMGIEALCDPLTILCKVGPLARNAQLKDLHSFDEYFTSFFKAHDIRALYDIYFDGDKEFDTVSYSELLSIGFIVVPCNDQMRYDLPQEAYEDDYLSLSENDVSFILEQTKDKYRLTRYRGKPIKRVVFLPGSNLFDDLVDMNRLEAEVKKGALIKPHPLTFHTLIHRLEKEFGEDQVLGHRVRGQEILESATHVSVTSNSEIGIKALLMNKEVQILDKTGKDSMLRPIFKQLYLAAFNQNVPARQALLKILGSPRSCVFWKWEKEKKLETMYSLMKEKHAALSHFSQ